MERFFKVLSIPSSISDEGYIVGQIYKAQSVGEHTIGLFTTDGLDHWYFETEHIQEVINVDGVWVNVTQQEKLGIDPDTITVLNKDFSGEYYVEPFPNPKSPITFECDVEEVLDQIKEMLLEKNRKYGNSALEPLRVFSTASPLEQLKVRIDDKLSRIKSGSLDEDEDVVDDLIGYLVLYKIKKQNEEN